MIERKGHQDRRGHALSSWCLPVLLWALSPAVTRGQGEVPDWLCELCDNKGGGYRYVLDFHPERYSRYTASELQAALTTCLHKLQSYGKVTPNDWEKYVGKANCFKAAIAVVRLMGSQRKEDVGSTLRELASNLGLDEEIRQESIDSLHAVGEDDYLKPLLDVEDLKIRAWAINALAASPDPAVQAHLNEMIAKYASYSGTHVQEALGTVKRYRYYVKRWADLTDPREKCEYVVEHAGSMYDVPGDYTPHKQKHAAAAILRERMKECARNHKDMLAEMINKSPRNRGAGMAFFALALCEIGVDPSPEQKNVLVKLGVPKADIPLIVEKNRGR